MRFGRVVPITALLTALRTIQPKQLALVTPLAHLDNLRRSLENAVQTPYGYAPRGCGSLCIPRIRKGNVESTLSALYTEAEIVHSALVRCDFGPFTEKVGELERLTDGIRSSLEGHETLLNNRLPKLAAAVTKEMNRRISRKVESEQDSQEVSETLLAEVRLLRGLLKVDQLADDLHSVSQISQRFNLYGEEMMKTMLGDLTRCVKLAEQAPRSVNDCYRTALGLICASPPGHLLLLQDRADKFRDAADWTQLLSSFELLLETLTKVDTPALLQHFAAIQNTCLMLDGMQRNLDRLLGADRPSNASIQPPEEPAFKLDDAKPLVLSSEQR